MGKGPNTVKHLKTKEIPNSSLSKEKAAHPFNGARAP
jgi:hypothetical protein